VNQKRKRWALPQTQQPDLVHTSSNCLHCFPFLISLTLVLFQWQACQRCRSADSWELQSLLHSLMTKSCTPFWCRGQLGGPRTAERPTGERWASPRRRTLPPACCAPPYRCRSRSSANSRAGNFAPCRRPRGASEA